MADENFCVLAHKGPKRGSCLKPMMIYSYKWLIPWDVDTTHLGKGQRFSVTFPSDASSFLSNELNAIIHVMFP